MFVAVKDTAEVEMMFTRIIEMSYLEKCAIRCMDVLAVSRSGGHIHGVNNSVRGLPSYKRYLFQPHAGPNA